MPEPRSREQRLTALWYGSAPPSLGLRLLATIYSVVLSVRRICYRVGLLRTRRVAVPVVVVGNVTVGGTGKTPLTAWLAQRLQSRGRRPGIASRGYGRQNPQAIHWVSASDDPLQSGDEPLMLLRQTGARVCVAPRRSDAARKLVEAGCDVILCDDGLQHLALARDFEIAVVDGSRGMGNGRLLPAGPLREPASRLSSVDAVVVQGEGPAAMTGAAPMLRMTLAADELRSVAGSERRGLAWLNGREVHAVTGIGNPHRFFDLLRSLGAQVREHALGDHHRFTAGDIEFADELPVLMTAKDAVKCTTLAGARHWFLTVSAQFAPEDEEWLLGRILALGSPEGRPRG